MTTSGAPGNVKPATFQPGAVRWTWYQIEGMLNSRCVSLASSGFPVAVCAPLTTQLLLPSDCRISRFVADRKSRAAGQGGPSNRGSRAVDAMLLPVDHHTVN